MKHVQWELKILSPLQSFWEQIQSTKVSAAVKIHLEQSFWFSFLWKASNIYRHIYLICNQCFKNWPYMKKIEIIRAFPSKLHYCSELNCWQRQEGSLTSSQDTEETQVLSPRCRGQRPGNDHERWEVNPTSTDTCLQNFCLIFKKIFKIST